MKYKYITFADFSPYVSGGPETYVGLEDQKEDYIARLLVLEKAIMYANENWAQNYSSEDTLKVFMAPEFFFRPKKGYYEDLNVIPEIFRLMSVETGKNIYKDWLFIFGTVVVSYLNPANERVILNSALVLKGGVKYDQITAGENCFVVIKENISDLDFSEIGNLIKPEVDEAGTESNISGFNGGGIFKIDDIVYGLEICLDNTKERLKNEEFDIHLVCSAGMGPYRWTDEHQPQYAFYVDGANNQGVVFKGKDRKEASNYVLLKNMALGELRHGNLFTSAKLKDLFHRMTGEEYAHEDSVKGGFAFYDKFPLE